jgi:CheY-like chemotaxis protein
VDCTTPHRILYVEDHDDTHSLMLFVLSRAGYDVTPVSSLAQEQAVLEQVGMQQPGEVAPFQQIPGKQPDAPILFMLSAIQEQNRHQTREAGAVAFLENSVGITETLDTVVQVMTLRH